MHDWQSLSHARWGCKYHVVIIPKSAGSAVSSPVGLRNAISGGAGIR